VCFWVGGGKKCGEEDCYGAQFRLTANLNLITEQTLKAQQKQQRQQEEVIYEHPLGDRKTRY